MSVYNVPFTSKLEMWSPSPSVTMSYHFNHTATTTTTTSYSTTQVQQESRFFHHEPVFYPSACMICGLPHHHPVPHTVMPYHPTTTLPAIITTPAPTVVTQLSPPIKKSCFTKTRRHIKPHKKLSLQFKYMTRKVLRILSFMIKAPLTTRRHNIYPVKRDRAD